MNGEKIKKENKRCDLGKLGVRIVAILLVVMMLVPTAYVTIANIVSSLAK